MPQLRKAVGAVGSAIKTSAGAIQTGVNAVKKAVGQTKPTEAEARAYLSKKGINIRTVDKLMNLKVFPNITMSAYNMGYDLDANRQRWESTLKLAGVTNRRDRGLIIDELASADIGAWMPLMDSDSHS
jgi:hypothetical protein